MELEQRVKALEYEMKILKNEIQRTLLDIQEQILVHYYPTLRSEDAVPSEGTLQAFEAIRAKQGVVPAVPSGSPAPIAKKVTLEEVRAAQHAPAETAASPNGDGAANVVGLSEWASRCAAHIGSERVTRLLDVSAKAGLIAPDARNVMQRVVSLSKEAAPEKVAVNDVLGALLKLYELLGRAADVEQALSLIEEAQLG
jgi:hypothetical protein